MTKHRVRRILLAVLVLTPLASLAAQQAAVAPPAKPAADMVARIFSSEFRNRPVPPPHWADGGRSYITREPAAGGGRDVVKRETATGKQLEVLITAAQLTPAGAKEPLEIEALSWSNDNQRVLVFTNTRGSGAANTRGDYWLLDLDARRAPQAGSGARRATLMFAKFSPDGTRVAYVRRTTSTWRAWRRGVGAAHERRLAHDHQRRLRLGERGGVRPARRLPLEPGRQPHRYWQFDLRGVGEFRWCTTSGTTREIVTGIPYPHSAPTRSS